MKIAVINFSGNVGKSTVARHLLLPRIPGAELVSVETLNADESQVQALRGRQFGELQEYLQTIDHAVVDIGASNVEELLELMRRYRGSHEDFDCFVVPTVPALKQQQDTIATLIDLSRQGIHASKIRLVFNMVDRNVNFGASFFLVMGYVKEQPVALANPACCMGTNEIYARVRNQGLDLATLAHDDTDYKALIAQAPSPAEKLALAQKLATRRLASGVVPELDACFAALELQTRVATPVAALVREPQ